MTSFRVVGPATGLLAIVVVTWLAGLRVNVSGSMPIGLYHVSRGAPAKGAMVLACLPESVAVFARSRGYVPSGRCPGATAPIGKMVLAMAGDSVQVTDTGLIVNGEQVQNTKPLAVDGSSRPIPRFPDGTYVVGADEIWLYSPYSKRSFDSRYFGPLPLNCVLSRVSRLLTVQ